MEREDTMAGYNQPTPRWGANKTKRDVFFLVSARKRRNGKWEAKSQNQKLRSRAGKRKSKGFLRRRDFCTEKKNW